MDVDPIDTDLLNLVDTGNLAAVKDWVAAHPGRLDRVRDEWGQTPLHRAAKTENYVLAAYIEGEMSDFYARDYRGLLAIDYPPGEYETYARKILQANFKSYHRSLSRMLGPLHPATVALSVDTWRRYARYRLLPEGTTGLMIACEQKRADIVQRLLKNGADPKATEWVEDRSAVTFAIDTDAGDCLKLLVEAEPSLRDHPVRFTVDQIPALLSPLHLASLKGRSDCVRLLIESGAAIDAHASGDRHAWTPLQLAALHGHHEVVRHLLDAGADPSLAESARGYNALQLAMEEQHEKATSHLELWAKNRGVDLLKPFHPDPNDGPLKFPLYHGPIHLLPGHCSMCAQDKPHCIHVSYLLASCPSCNATKAYDVDDAGEVTRCAACDRLGDWPAEWPIERDAIRVCYECLRAGRAAVSHSTELGHLRPPDALRGMINSSDRGEEKARELNFPTTVLKTYDDGSYSMGVHVPQPFIDELMRTPRHPAFQEEYWPFHCNGWMEYLGQWRPEDFNRRSPGRGREWLGEHIDDPEMAEDYWSWLESGIAGSCVYRCPRCGLHKVWVDAD